MRFYLFVAFLVAGYISLFPIIDDYSKSRLRERDVRYVPQKELIDVSSLEYKAIVSDMLFLNTLSFLGGRDPAEDAEAWQWLYKTLDASSYLNPYNMDPYYVAEGFLPWKGRMFHETNAILNRGMEYRTHDWVMPFFIGFNHYFFMNEPEKGAQYIELAAQKPNAARTTLITLASRLYAQSARTELAIALVKDDYDKAADEGLRVAYKTRLKSLYARLKIEKAVEAYKKAYKRSPASLETLVVKDFLKEVPINPEGGVFILDNDGRIKATIEAKGEKKAQMYR